MNSISIAVVTLALTLSLAAADAVAQFPGGGQGGRGGTGATGGRNGQDRRPDRAPDTPVSLMGQVEVQLDRLEEELHITLAQQPAWDSYARKVIRLADDVARARFAVRTAQDAPPSTAMQQFDRLAEAARNRVTVVDEIADAGRALYGTLTQEQKAIADRRLLLVALPLANGLTPVAQPRAGDREPPPWRPPGP